MVKRIWVCIARRGADGEPIIVAADDPELARLRLRLRLIRAAWALWPGGGPEYRANKARRQRFWEPFMIDGPLVVAVEI